mgnify:CR=1 FL=1|jgi:hypothetical protein
MVESQQETTNKTPWHLWVIGIAGLLWSSMGAFDYLMTQTQNESYMSSFTPEQLSFFHGLPSWIIAAWAIGVWGGVVGAILLLLKKSASEWVFLASMIAVVITTFRNYILSNGIEIMGGASALVFTALIFLIALGLYLYARAMHQKGFLK